MKLKVLLLFAVAAIATFLIMVTVYLTKQQQDIRQKAAGGLLEADVLLVQFGNYYSAVQMADYANLISQLITEATNGDIKAKVTIGQNYLPPPIATEELEAMKNNPRFAHVKDSPKLLELYRYYEGWGKYLEATNKVSAAFPSGTYNFVFVLSNYQSSIFGGYSWGNQAYVAHPMQIGAVNKHVLTVVPWIMSDGKPANTPLFDRAAYAGVIVHELGHDLKANHPCNRCFKHIDGESDGINFFNADTPVAVSEKMLSDCCNACKWKDDIMSYCSAPGKEITNTTHGLAVNKKFSSCSIQRMESFFTSGSSVSSCNDGTEKYLATDKQLGCSDVYGENFYCSREESCMTGTVSDPSRTTTCSSPFKCCKQSSTKPCEGRDKKDCSSTPGCFWFKGVFGEYPSCRSGVAGESCGTESYCYKQGTTGHLNEVCYFESYCEDKSILGNGEPCNPLSDQCGPNLRCNSNNKCGPIIASGTGIIGSYCGTRDGKAPDDNLCASGYCHTENFRCAIRPTPTPFSGTAPAIATYMAQTCANSKPDTVTFHWTRPVPGLNYEIRWGNGFTESITVGDRDQSDPIAGFSPAGTKVPYQIRAYVGDNIGPYTPTKEFTVPSTCTPSASKLVCDFNKNGSYDDGDIGIWRQDFLSGSTTSDCNSDGKVDIFDYNVWLEKSQAL